jgi:signal peptidase II
MDTADGQGAVPAAESDRRPAREQGPSAEGETAALSAEGGRPAPPAEIPESDAPPPADTATAAADGRVRRIRVLLAVAVIVYALDLASKTLVVAMMHYGQPIRLLGPVLQLVYTRNSGAAFSIGETYTIIFTAIAVGVIAVILRLARSLFSLPWAIALGLLLGGALGNLTDRITRDPGVLRGWVVDFIQVPHWPIFNLADSAICVGGALMVLLAFRGLHPDGTDERAAARSQNAPAGDGGNDGDAGHDRGHQARDARTGTSAAPGAPGTAGATGAAS